MKNHAKYFITAAILFFAWNLSGQQVRYMYVMPQQYKAVSPLLIDWKPEATQGQRWTVAARPFYLFENGLKLDFEFELARPGNWLRIELAGHHRRQFRDNDRYYSSGWSHIASNYDTYTRLEGGGGGLAFKSMWSPRGWYYSAGVTLNYFKVYYNEAVYQPYTDGDGNKMWEKIWGQSSSEYYKPAVTFDIGKHFALGGRVFLDAFIGLGYAWNISDNPRTDYYDYSPYSFGGSGLYFNTGFRIGVLLGR